MEVSIQLVWLEQLLDLIKVAGQRAQLNEESVAQLKATQFDPERQ